MNLQTTLAYKLKEIEGDMITPISIYRLLSGSKKMLFESSAKHEESGRYSFIAVDPIAEFKADAAGYELSKKDGTKETGSGKFMDKLKSIMPVQEEQPYPFPFFGGAAGYIGYDTVFFEEKIGEPLTDELGMPDVHMMFYDTFVVYDHLMQRVTIAAVDLFGGRTEEEMETAIETIYNDIHTGQKPDNGQETQALMFRSSLERNTFCQMVERAKEHIIRGDIFQVVLSQRLSSPFEGDPFTLYRRLRTSNPSPYMFYIDFEGYTVLGTSPESLVKVSGRTVTTNPIAGTRPRGSSPEEDARLAEELLADEKEIAEHRMLVDLGRNDVGKISEIGSVTLDKYMKIERYKHVMHIVSEVSGELKEDYHPLDALTACLPAGTVSGAPKIRAMQIINDLEPVKRGVYSGAVGYLSATGSMDFALAIRTMVIKDGKAHVQAGAGIVYDSVPETEYEETMHKAKALLEVQK
ncbi:anthranilate synthase component I [Domibacillus indicus]|uniref:anthranilate synthase component I n=1 Tax=Domibacillus indicus TaxID=1437523 RepID=UPI00203C1874|nr:anthranilate synthase component I [Domibacillus indicus]MCM3788111.1 anthranilate synthase component I [Domibacillus indicus]